MILFKGWRHCYGSQKFFFRVVLGLRCGIRYLFNRVNFIYLSNLYDARDYWVILQIKFSFLCENFLIEIFFLIFLIIHIYVRKRLSVYFRNYFYNQIVKSQSSRMVHNPYNFFSNKTTITISKWSIASFYLLNLSLKAKPFYIRVL